MERLADSNVTIIRHGSEKEKFRHTHADEEKQLSQAIVIGNGLDFGHD